MENDEKRVTTTNINWYPGHMAKAKREIAEVLPLVDIVLELRDARIPSSSKNPMIDDILKNKPRLILLNKATLADPKETKAWINALTGDDIYALDIDSISGYNMKQIQPFIKKILAPKLEAYAKKGLVNKSLRALVVGIPNVGKSTFINSFTGRKSAKTGNKPGVTKGKQWIRINGSVELLDTPGILWPKIEDRNVGERLAMIGSINDQILNIEELALETIKFLKKNYQPQLYSRYDITEDIFDNVDTETMMNPENAAALCIMEHIARKRGCIKKGSDIDYEKCAACILDDFREGKIGTISLERP